MASHKNEQLSAWMDGESDDSRIVDSVLDNDELRAAFNRYQWVGEALRDELPEDLTLDITASVAEALEKEPTVLAPGYQPTLVAPLGKRGKVVQLFKQAGQYAIAASVAAMAIVGVQQYQQGVDEQPVPVLTTMPVTGMAAPVSLEAERPKPQVSEEERERFLLEQRRRANAYLMDHQQQIRIGVTEQVQPVEANR